MLKDWVEKIGSAIAEAPARTEQASRQDLHSKVAFILRSIKLCDGNYKQNEASIMPTN
jgi:hypothetical protein